MLVLVSGASATLRALNDPAFGRLLCPRSGLTADIFDYPWAIDNDAFSGFNVERFESLLDRCWRRQGCLFAVAPDVVADADATLVLFAQWRGRIQRAGFPVALALQDGMTVDRMPRGVDAVFVGGTTDWKLGRSAQTLVAYAKARGLWVHMGRVNTRKRLHYAAAIGCDSVDGSGFSKWSRTRLPMASAWLSARRNQRTLAF